MLITLPFTSTTWNSMKPGRFSSPLMRRFVEAGLGESVIFSPSVKLKSTKPVTKGVNDCNTPVLNEELSENLNKAIDADSPML